METKGDNLSNNQQMQNKIDQLKSSISGNESEIVKYGSGITKGFDQPSLLVYLNETVNKNASKISFQFTDIKPLGQLEACDVRVVMTGTYDGLKKILSDLNTGKYLVNVISLKASVHTDDPSTASPTTTDTAPNQKVGSNSKPKPSASPSPIASGESDLLDITMDLQFYNYPGDVPPNTSYPFVTSSTQYGGDIFY